MADRFPKDCWGKNCPHFKYWDMSIDDLCCSCDLLKIQCDACDEAFSLYICPLPNEPQKLNHNSLCETETYKVGDNE